MCSTTPSFAAESGANLSSCTETFDNADSCPDDGLPIQTPSSCGDGKEIAHANEMGCELSILSLSTDCDQWCQDEGHDSGVCQEAAVEVTCPSGATVQAAQCVCS